MAYEASEFLKSELEIVVANKARRDEVYFQHFSSEAKPKSPPRRVNVTELNILFISKFTILNNIILRKRNIHKANK